ncbi:MAG: hemin uptake protein HemP [Thauera phenolivorans]|uniref:Hemin uptake protein HemP n=2 Tax=Thauera phenolivorans TaxID=1792543 RepID=A0A7X7R8J6_9RHOO|nr:hemin uptake protein HemP [Thauera phenolivorans]
MISVTTPPHRAEPGGSAAHATESEPRPTLGTAIPSAMLLGGRDTVAIEHRGVIYVLRATRAGKLILTK